MNEMHLKIISQELDLKYWQTEAAARLLSAEATVPFIARYRKEVTGSLDEVAVTAVRDRLTQLAELEKRRDSILASLTERNILTDELQAKIMAAGTMTVLEDIYLPYRPKRRTRATMAKEKGLEPLADLIWAQNPEIDPETEARAFVDQTKEVAGVEEALAGARDILAERISEDQQARTRIRRLFEEEGLIQSKVAPDKEAEGAKFRDYFDWQEPVGQIPSHRVLAMRRGEAEGILHLKLRPPEDRALDILSRLFVRGESPSSKQVDLAVHDAYRRLLSLSMETETRLKVKKEADAEAIGVFAENLRELLLAAPLGQKRILAVDPGFRTGCKVACLDAQGRLVSTDSFHVIGSKESLEASARKVADLCARYRPEAVAVGNGTASRETEAFLKEAELCGPVAVVMVNESGASVYSASEEARREFPDLDVSYRGAVSIGRRLMDPLAELVKIDPKSIGVGQYQHDVNQSELKKSLKDVVISCVNAVGVEVNLASREILTYISGLGPVLAQNIIDYRDQNGPFLTRKDLLKVPRLGPKAFEQAAGFLRIRNSRHPLDSSAVHPESYQVVEKMARDLNCSVADLLKDKNLRNQIEPSLFVTDKIGLPTLTDIMKELEKPGRDPRQEFKVFSFDQNINTIDDLKPGQRLPGVVTNVTAFGAFVDVGVHQDGLVHISEMADHFVKDPHQVVKVHQQVMVTVLSVDLDRNRIGLSLRENPGQKQSDREKPAPGRRPQGKKKGRKEPSPFNNPFARAFKK